MMIPKKFLIALIALLLALQIGSAAGVGEGGSRATLKFTTVGIKMTYDMDDLVSMSSGVPM